MHTPTSVITIERYIMEQERLHPEATGELSNLLYDLCLAAKIISRQVGQYALGRLAGLQQLPRASREHHAPRTRPTAARV